jgi:hypothetical protein
MAQGHPKHDDQKTTSFLEEFYAYPHNHTESFRLLKTNCLKIKRTYFDKQLSSLKEVATYVPPTAGGPYAILPTNISILITT